MRYLSFFASVERETPPTGEEIEAMGKYMEEETKAGRLIYAEGCLPSAHGARVRLDNGKVTVTDGPFSESKEVVGGFAILEAASKEDAIEQAKTFIKLTGDGVCEIRALYPTPAKG